nr:hypothetical protein [Tanacetum cinerariifolium]
MFTRSIVIQRRVEDLQLGVESYQKKLNLTKPDTYRSDLKRKEAYTAYFNLRGFIYQNKDKHNRLMRIDELHKFRDGTLNDVRTALDDCLKGIRMNVHPTFTLSKTSLVCKVIISFSGCPELKNQDHGNQVGGTEARRMMYALRGGENDQDLDNMEDDINA